MYASILPLFAYALLGSSMTLAVGPVAVISLMTGKKLISPIATPGSPEYLGATDLVEPAIRRHPHGTWFARAGFLANLLSHPVISGFISASAI